MLIYMSFINLIESLESSPFIISLSHLSFILSEPRYTRK